MDVTGQPTQTARRAARVGLVCAAVGVGLFALFWFVLAQPEPVCGGDYGEDCTDYPLGKVVAYAAAALAVVLSGAGLLALLVASFRGPRPGWWSRPDGTPRAGWGGLIALGTVIGAAYAFASLPLLGEDANLAVLAAGLVCGVGALRASSYAVAIVLGAVAIPLALVGGGTAAVLLGHGALTIGSLALLALCFWSERAWVRVLAALGFLAGVVAWLYTALFLLIVLPCEYGGACLS